MEIKSGKITVEVDPSTVGEALSSETDMLEFAIGFVNGKNKPIIGMFNLIRHTLKAIEADMEENQNFYTPNELAFRDDIESALNKFVHSKKDNQ